MPKITATDIENMGFTPAMFDRDETTFPAFLAEVINEQSALLQGRIGAARYASTETATAALVKRAEKAMVAADLYQIRFNRIAETIDDSGGIDAFKLRRTQENYAKEAETLIGRLAAGAVADSGSYAGGVVESTHRGNLEWP
jgi:hypothetical protein